MRTTLTSHPVRLMAVAFAAAVTLSACGGGDDPTLSAPGGGDTTKGESVPGIDAEHNDADIAFIQEMDPHHASAIEMAELAATRAGSAEVKALAERIVAAQDPEMELMAKMAKAWGVELGAGGADHSMGGGEEAAALENLSGAEFDRAFLTAMTAHHEAALEMAQKQLAEGENPQAKQLAQDIVEAQTAEIAEMKKMLAAL